MKKSLTLVSLIFLVLCSVIHAEEIEVVKNSRFAKESGRPVSIATNTQTGEMLVVWTQPRAVPTDPPAEIFGRILNSKGKPITKPVLLAVQQDHDVTKHSVSYNPDVNEYLLVYDNYPEPCHLFSLRVDAKGQSIGVASKITTDPDIQTYCSNGPTVLYDPKTKGHSVFWEVHVFGGNPRPTYNAAISLDEKGIPDEPLVEIDGGEWIYLPSAGKLLGLFFQTSPARPDAYDIYLGRVDPRLENAGAKLKKVNRDPIVPTSSCSCDGGLHLALISEDSAVVYFKDSEGLIRGRAINKKGKPKGSEFFAFNTPKENTKFFLVHAAFTDTPDGIRGVLIGTERTNDDTEGTIDGPSHLWAQLVDKDGIPIGSPVQILTIANDAWIYGRLAPLQKTSPDTSDRFVAFETVSAEERGSAEVTESKILRLLLQRIEQ